MDTKQLITFVTLAEEKNYARVSQKLNYASSTLMEHVRSLEEELGCRLTEREGKQTVLTSAGREFLSYADKILRLQQEAREAVEASRGVGRIRIATAESIGQYSMARLFQEYKLHYPNCVTSIKVANCATFPEMLLEKQIDFGYIYDMDSFRSQALESVALFREPLYFVVHPEHPLAGKKQVMAEDFEGERLALTYEDCCYSMALKQMLARRNVTLRAQNHLGSVNMVKNCIRQNYGVALLPLCAIEEEVKSGQFCRLNWAEDTFSVLAQVLYLKGRELTGAMEKLLELSLQYGAQRTAQLNERGISLGNSI